jgi:hypothetical protein
MPQVRQVPHQDAEYLRKLYRSLGVSEQTLERAIGYPESCTDQTMPEEPTRKRRHGRKNAKLFGRTDPAAWVRRRSAKR